MPKGVTGSGAAANADVVQLSAKVPKNVMRAFKVYCVLGDRNPGGVIALALTRFLESEGDATVKKLLAGEEAPARGR